MRVTLVPPLQVRQLFTSLFHACMEITNSPASTEELVSPFISEDQAKDAVGRRVNRAHIYDHGLIAHGIDVERFDHFGVGLANAEDSAVIAASKNSLGGVGGNWCVQRIVMLQPLGLGGKYSPGRSCTLELHGNRGLRQSLCAAGVRPSHGA